MYLFDKPKKFLWKSTMSKTIENPLANSCPINVRFEPKQFEKTNFQIPNFLGADSQEKCVGQKKASVDLELSRTTR